MNRRALISLSLAFILAVGSCVQEPPIVVGGGTTPTGSGGTNSEPAVPESAPDAVSYSSLHDPVKDAGQFYIPESKLDPKACWTLVYSGAGYGRRNDPGLDDIDSGLQNFLLMQSIVGLVNRACEQGRTDIAIWVENGGRGYLEERETLGPEIGRQTAVELATKSYGKWEGLDVSVRHLFDGYVLTDIRNNPESANVAAVASSVYNAIIVDVRDREFFEDAGYVMRYDASRKTLREAFDEFKDRCCNDCLVLMPVGCGEHRDFAIKNNLFIVNINKNLAAGDRSNMGLYREVLQWLEPVSQVLGWEQGIGESEFVSPASEFGHMVLAADWSYNLTLMSHNYKERQPETLVKTINPRTIDYDSKAHYYSTFLTDGDNYQFIITDNFIDNYYNLASAESSKTAFELGTQSLIQLAPTRFSYLARRQPSAHNTIMETFGGGYYYIDNFATDPSCRIERAAALKILARRTAAHMRQHNIKVLHLMAQNIRSREAREAMQAFVDANDQLEGITAVQYSLYTGGGGDVIWLTNKAGYDIPCITTRYMTWEGISTPDNVVSSMINKEIEKPSFCTVCLHCWSMFGNCRSTDIAVKLDAMLPSSFKCVSMQELIWRLRMEERRDQTRKYLSTIK